MADEPFRSFVLAPHRRTLSLKLLLMLCASSPSVVAASPKEAEVLLCSFIGSSSYVEPRLKLEQLFAMVDGS